MESGQLGAIEHVQVHMAGAMRQLMSGETGKQQRSTWADPQRSGGYAWGQLCHILAWVFRVSGLDPAEVFCFMQRGPVHYPRRWRPWRRRSRLRRRLRGRVPACGMSPRCAHPGTL